LPLPNYANVPFEVDEIDRRTHSGWSVLVLGLAAEVMAGYHGEYLNGTAADRLVVGVDGAEAGAAALDLAAGSRPEEVVR
jgi:hypothetical protein